MVSARRNPSPYNSTNAITSGTYDANGIPTVLSGKSYEWDVANRVVHSECFYRQLLLQK
jgi:hypothetical protein